MVLAEIRLVPVHGIPGRDVLTVTSGPSNLELETINIVEARELVASGSARWVGEPPELAGVSA